MTARMNHKQRLAAETAPIQPPRNDKQPPLPAVSDPDDKWPTLTKAQVVNEWEVAQDLAGHFRDKWNQTVIESFQFQRAARKLEVELGKAQEAVRRLSAENAALRGKSNSNAANAEHEEEVINGTENRQ